MLRAKSAREKKSGMCCKASGVNEPPNAFVADEFCLFLCAHEIVYCVHKVRLCNEATKQNIGQQTPSKKSNTSLHLEFG